VTGRKRDAVREPLNGNGVAVVYMRGNRRAHIDEF
jgi:hypothetical protein